MSTERKIVKFRKAWRGYNAGEIAGFPADEADKLIAGEVAEETAAEKSATRAQTRKKADPQKGDGGTGGTELKEDGPTVQQYVDEGYDPSTYPPTGYASRSTDEDIAAAVAAYKAKQAPADNSDRP